MFRAASSAGIPEPLVEYIRSLFAGSRTRLRESGGLSDKVNMNRGIRQVGEQTFSCLAFTNDLVLLTMSSRCQQHQFTAIELPCVVFNTHKCSTVRIDVHERRRCGHVTRLMFCQIGARVTCQTRLSSPLKTSYVRVPTHLISSAKVIGV